MNKYGRIALLITLGIYSIIGLVIFGFFAINNSYNKSTNPSDYLEYVLLEDDTYEVSGFSGRRVEDVIIPSVHNNKEVSSIGYNAFNGKRNFFLFKDLQINSIYIEEGITNIENCAFMYCNSKSIHLPESLLYVGAYAFVSTEASINFPSNILEIGDSAFSYCDFGGDLFLSENIILGTDVFSSSQVTSVVFEEGTQSVSEMLFNNCMLLTNVTFPSTLKYIGSYAFNSTNLNTITIPYSIIKIDGSAFSYCNNLVDVYIPNKAFDMSNSFSYSYSTIFILY